MCNDTTEGSWFVSATPCLTCCGCESFSYPSIHSLFIIGMYSHVSESSAMYQPRRPPMMYHRPSAFSPNPSFSPSVARRYYSTQTSPTYYQHSVAPVSPTNSADEVEAAAALISLPSAPSSTVAASFKEPPPQSYGPIAPRSAHKTKAHATFSSQVPSYKLDARFTPTNDYQYSPVGIVVTPPRSIESPSPTFKPEETFSRSCLPTNSQQEWYSGSTSLSLPDDDNALSPLHCFLRKYCVEAFSATEQDVAFPRYGKSHGGKIVLHQVGIRCIHCKSYTGTKPERAVCYPSSVKNIYHSIETWQRRHAPVCRFIPCWIKRELTRLIETSKSTGGGRRQYWQDAARKVGMVDTPSGVRFGSPPGIAFEKATQDSSCPRVPLVSLKDKDLVTDFLFVLMEQMETCQFAEEDRSGGRSKIKDYPVGFGGMQCKHCRGMAGFGRYFPSSINALSLANSDRNIYNHLKKCRKCPESIKRELQELQTQESVKNKRGSRKQFFSQIWTRIHG